MTRRSARPVLRLVSSQNHAPALVRRPYVAKIFTCAKEDDALVMMAAAVRDAGEWVDRARDKYHAAVGVGSSATIIRFVRLDRIRRAFMKDFDEGKLSLSGAADRVRRMHAGLIDIVNSQPTGSWFAKESKRLDAVIKSIESATLQHLGRNLRLAYHLNRRQPAKKAAVGKRHLVLIP